MGRRLIRASELGEYAYCRRSWWLRNVEGEEPGNAERLARGIELHRRHGQLTASSGWLLWVGLALVAAAALLLAL